MATVHLCSSADSWYQEYLPELADDLSRLGHEVACFDDHVHLPGGDLCFILSYVRIVPRATRDLYEHNVVVHASRLPQGRGWSPVTWQILEGSRNIPLVAFEAVDDLDAGPILARGEVLLTGTELVDEIRREQAAATRRLCLDVVRAWTQGQLVATPQVGAASFYRRRTAEDSRLDPRAPIEEQMNLLRVVDNERYPAWFELGGRRYLLRIEVDPRGVSGEPS